MITFLLSELLSALVRITINKVNYIQLFLEGSMAGKILLQYFI